MSSEVARAGRMVAGMRALAGPEAHLPSAEELAAIQQARSADAETWVWGVLPRRPDPPWRVLELGQDGYACLQTKSGLRLIASGSREADGKRWLHVSVSYADHMPTYEDLAEAKRAFIGETYYAYQVFAPRSRHVNMMRWCLHLWCCLDAPKGQYLPDFTAGFDTV